MLITVGNLSLLKRLFSVLLCYKWIQFSLANNYFCFFVLNLKVYGFNGNVGLGNKIDPALKEPQS